MHQQTKASSQDLLVLESLKVPEVATRIDILRRQKGKRIKFKGTPPLHKFVLDMNARGFTYIELSEFLSVSEVSIANWISLEKKRRFVREALIQQDQPPEPAPAPAQIQMPEPKLVAAGTITMIRAPRRSLWQRIKDFFE